MSLVKRGREGRKAEERWEGKEEMRRECKYKEEQKMEEEED